MSEIFEINERHSYLRNKLDILGFNQPLPIGALSVVSAILDDLIKTTDSLKKSKEELNQLREVCANTFVHKTTKPIYFYSFHGYLNEKENDNST